jgi:hypothetical protein
MKGWLAASRPPDPKNSRETVAAVSAACGVLCGNSEFHEGGALKKSKTFERF